MAQKIQYCIITSRWEDDANAFVETYHKDKLYDLDDKASLKALALDSLNFLVKGFKVKLSTFIDRDAISISDERLF